MAQAIRLTGTPTLERTWATALRVLSRLPVAGAIVLVVSSGSELTGLGAEPVVSALVALLSGLACTRLRRAQAVSRWEANKGETALVAGSAGSGTRYRVRPPSQTVN